MSKADIAHIIFLLKAGDVSVLETIYKENRSPFLSFAKKYKLPKEDIIDVYQDAIIALRDNIVNGKVELLDSTIRTYLFSIGKYMIYKKVKAYKSEIILAEEIKNQDGQISHFDYYENINSSNQQLVNTCFSKLGEKCQHVLKLFYYEGLTLKEIQQYLGYDNYNVIKSQKSRCLRTLKGIIDKHKQNG